MREWSSSFMHDEYGEPSFLVWIWRIVKIGTSFGTILNSSNILKEIDTTYIDGICWIQCMFYWIWNIRRHTSEKMKPTTIAIGLVISRYFYNNPRNKRFIISLYIGLYQPVLHRFWWSDHMPMDKERRWAVFRSSNSSWGLNWTHLNGF